MGKPPQNGEKESHGFQNIQPGDRGRASFKASTEFESAKVEQCGEKPSFGDIAGGFSSSSGTYTATDTASYSTIAIYLVFVSLMNRNASFVNPLSRKITLTDLIVCCLLVVMKTGAFNYVRA